MRRNLLLLLAIACLLVAACAQATAAPTPSPSPLPPSPTQEPAPPFPTSLPPEPTPEPTVEAVEASPVVFTLAGLDQEMTFTMEQLKTLPATSGQAGMVSSTGKITVPAEYTGVLLTDLVELVGGLTPELGVSIVAQDGYAMTLSYEQVMNGTFITYDPSDGSEKEYKDPLQALVAYEVNGEPLDPRSDGNLRLVIISEKNNQITDGHWSVKWTERVEVQPVGREWTLALNGVREEVIDRNTFQSCGATSCHQATWTDEEGQVWSGVPLYLLAGRMDDQISHEGPAFNRELSNAGYQIELVASDGYTTTIDSAAAFYNRKIIVAYLVDDNPLPDKYFPLRLVGEDVEKGQQVGSLEQVRLVLTEAGELLAADMETGQTETPAAEGAPAGEPPSGERPDGAALWITGQVANPLALNAASIQALPAVQITAEHPKRGLEEFEGVSLNTLLALAGPEEGSAALVLTASDGYSTSLDLAAVAACADCLLAFGESEAVFNLAMPGFDSAAWIKEISTIEVN